MAEDLLTRRLRLMEQRKSKVFDIALRPVANMVEEFDLKAVQPEGTKTVEIEFVPERTRDIEDETLSFDTFLDKDGYLYVGQPALPLPARVTSEDLFTAGKTHKLTLYPFDNTYGIIHERGFVNFVRNIRFFFAEIRLNAMHFDLEEQQIKHPLKETNNG